MKLRYRNRKEEARKWNIHEREKKKKKRKNEGISPNTGRRRRGGR
jgi:hypothetical protein